MLQKTLLFFLICKAIISDFLEKQLIEDTYLGVSYIEFEKNNLLHVYYTAQFFSIDNTELIKVDLEKDKVIETKVLSERYDFYAKLNNNLEFILTENGNAIIIEGGRKYSIPITDGFFRKFGFGHNSDSCLLILTFSNFNSYAYYFKHPYSSIYKNFTNELFNSPLEKFKIIPLKNSYLIFYRLYEYIQEEGIFIFNNIIQMYDLDMNLLKTKDISLGDETDLLNVDISAISDNEYFNEFFIYVLYKDKSICKIFKYHNSDIIFKEDIEICSNLKNNYGILKFHLYQENNKNNIFFTCQRRNGENDFTDIITILNYENGIFEIKENFNQFIPKDSPLFILYKDAKMISSKKGLSLIYVDEAIYRGYLFSVCDSRRIYLQSNGMNNFPIEEILYQGMNESLFFSFSFIPEEMEIYKNNKKIKENEIFTDTDGFSYIFNFGDIIKPIYHLQINMNKNDYFCDIEIEIKGYTISVGLSKYNCILDKSIGRINNIKKHNLNRTLNYQDNNEIEIFFTYIDDLPKGNELIFYYEKYQIKCKSNNKNVTCKIPIVIIKMKQTGFIYSKLSCRNLIKIGWIIVEDEYIKNVYELIPLVSYTKIKEKYTPSELISEYNNNMGNYYYWFACFAYCDDDVIKNKKCCPEILKDWNIVFHKEYYMDLGSFVFSSLKQFTSDEDVISQAYIYLLEKLTETYFKEIFNNIIYYYNFAILKNDKYKKIIVAFPGTTNVVQLALEIFCSNLIDIPNKNNGDFKASKMFYDTFKTIKDDLINSLLLLHGINSTDYQIIFVGHSLGGALATISSFYYINQDIFKSEPILITYGQPRVGNEAFAKYLTNNIKQIYRFARGKDQVTVIPFKYQESIMQSIFSLFNFVTRKVSKFILHIFSLLDSTKPVNIYSHIGGLYMIDDDKRKIFNCEDFYNENTKHFICKNFGLNLLEFGNLLNNHGYMSLGQSLMSNCQKNKRMKLVFFRKFKKEKNVKYLKCDYSRENYFSEINGIRYQDFKEIKKMENNIEYRLENSISDIWIQYDINQNIESNDLVLKINPNNFLFFGTICFYKNSLVDEEMDSCYNINTKTHFTINIDIEEISDLNILYCHIKGKISGYIELLNFSLKKYLNLNNSYYFQKIENISSEKNLYLSIPEIKENINLNIFLINNNCSAFEIYENHEKIKCDDELSSSIILQKNKKYYFKYYPFNNNELIINFLSLSSNDFLDKFLYSFDSKNLYINYNIENIDYNNSIGLFYDINGKIKIEGFFSNISIVNNISSNLSEKYDISIEEKYFYIQNNYNTSYLNLNLYFYYMNIYDFKIYSLNEKITINKINFKYNLKRNKNVLFVFYSELIRKYLIFNSFILISINNTKNTIKLTDSNNNIISYKNFALTNLVKTKEIFILVEEDDIFEIRLIPEKISKYIKSNNPTIYSNIMRQDNKFEIEYIYQEDYNLLFYNYMNKPNNELQIYQLNNSIFNIDDVINNEYDYNYINITNFTYLDPFKTYILVNKCKNKCMYMKYINTDYDFEYFLDESQIIYLFMDFEYKINYNENITEIKFEKLNNFEDQIQINCNSKIINIDNSEEIINIEECEGEFTIKGNNSLIYIYLPITLNKDYTIIENKTSFILKDVSEFFFIPNENNYNSINIHISNKDFVNTNKSKLCINYIDYDRIPFSKNIKKKYIKLEENVYINVPNYKQNYSGKEKYYIYFNFLKNISNIEINIVYDNIIKIDGNEFNIIIPSGKNLLQLENQENYYIKIIKKNNHSNIIYSILRNDISKPEEENIILNSDYIYFNSTSYNEDIKLKIENDDDIVFLLSSNLFYDLNMIIFDKNIYIEKNENIIDIKFNTTSYESKLEYYIIINKNYNIENYTEFLYHQIINTDTSSFIYKNIISTIGIEPISIQLNIDKFPSINEKYIIIVLGKENFGETFHYKYYEPKIFYINDESPDKTDEEKRSANISIWGIIGIIIGIISLLGISFIIYYIYRKKRNKKEILLDDIDLKKEKILEN